MRRQMVVGLVALACFMTLPTAASATEWWWKSGLLSAGARDASGSVSQLRASGGIAESNARKIRVGAHLPGGWTLYASFVEGWGSACHSYAGTMSLGGLLENPHTVNQLVLGVVRYPAWEIAC